MRTTISVRDNQVTSKLFLDDGTYNITIQKKYDDKTLEQVRKLWVTCSDISQVLYGDKSQKDNIYFQILHMAGVRTDLLVIKEISLPLLQKAAKSVQIVSREVVNHIPMLTVDVCFTGISDMNKKELSQVIESCIKYASEVGVENQWI